ncbi:hypothetical protein NDQ72_01420 [Halomonas sp. KG2]|uniref:hypothetical protein n=1 Tax=Halomonas sp. KG2 TaxID=2951138 RepID=UPI002648F944|nr:hypothetical protein [Halomonas sp. KG2]WKD28634.1 hypothetical protein NDQ72_01420 [Halomonas sp. KG2]
MKLKNIAVFTITSLALASSLSAFAQEREFKGGNYVACVSEDLLDQFVDAAVKNDNRAMNYLLNNGCTAPRSGIPVSVLDSSWTGTVHVRAYVGDQAIELWTIRDALTDR